MFLSRMGDKILPKTPYSRGTVSVKLAERTIKVSRKYMSKGQRILQNACSNTKVTALQMVFLKLVLFSNLYTIQKFSCIISWRLPYLYLIKFPKLFRNKIYAVCLSSANTLLK